MYERRKKRRKDERFSGYWLGMYYITFFQGHRALFILLFCFPFLRLEFGTRPCLSVRLSSLATFLLKPIYTQRLRRDSRIAAMSILNQSQSNPLATSNLVAVTVAVANVVCNSTVHNLCNWFGSGLAALSQSLDIKGHLVYLKPMTKCVKKLDSDDVIRTGNKYPPQGCTLKEVYIS